MIRHVLVPIVVLCTLSTACGAEPAAPSAERGLELLLNRAYLPPDFDEKLFDDLWTSWPEDVRKRAEAATPEVRRRMTFARYGMHVRPGDDDVAEGPPLDYVDDGKGNWVANCFLCHGGTVNGKVVPGAPNADIDMRGLADDLRNTRLRTGRGLTPADISKLTFPLGSSVGVTNATAFGIVFGALRDADMEVATYRAREIEHHDVDAPPWWHVKHRKSLYIDGFAPKNHRVIMQFALDPVNDRDRILGWEDDFRHILAYIESVEAPEYPWPIDEELAATGLTVFEKNCARCHGTYGDGGADEVDYTEVMVPLEEIGTDPLRHRGLTPEFRGWLKQSWMSHHGEDPVIVEPAGYVAPPLTGVWASAPYLHNGSVPTLWHLLHPDERPTVWRKCQEDFDTKRVGVSVETYPAMPETVQDSYTRRRHYDTTQPGKSAAGHDFPDALDESEKRAVLEYLKTL